MTTHVPLQAGVGTGHFKVTFYGFWKFPCPHLTLVDWREKQLPELVSETSYPRPLQQLENSNLQVDWDIHTVSHPCNLWPSVLSTGAELHQEEGQRRPAQGGGRGKFWGYRQEALWPRLDHPHTGPVTELKHRHLCTVPVSEAQASMYCTCL